MYFIDGHDKAALRHWYAFDASPLVDAKTDTLLQVGENGIFYTIKLNSRFDPTAGTVSIAPETVKYVYRSKISSRPGMENSVAVYNHYACFADIHKMCMVPDMTDLNFAGNSSGVAMRYKLLGLEQLTRIKERWFREGLMQRIRLYAGYLQLTGMPEMDADAVRPVFTRALPVNELEIAQTISQLRGLVEDEKLLRKAEASLGV